MDSMIKFGAIYKDDTVVAIVNGNMVKSKALYPVDCIYVEQNLSMKKFQANIFAYNNRYFANNGCERIAFYSRKLRDLFIEQVNKIIAQNEENEKKIKTWRLW